MSIAPIRRKGGPNATAETAASWVLRQEEGPLSEQDEERFAAWLASDLSHVEAYEDAAWALDAAAHHAGEEPIRAMRAAALAARGPRNPRRWLGALGGALAASLAAFWLLIAQPSAPDPVSAVAPDGAAFDPNNAVYRTQIGERLTVNLPDGSVATLDTNSELRVAYSATERRLSLRRGQALFEVAHRRTIPFRVDAADRQVVALGTIFNVRIDGAELRVALLEGRVRVRTGGRPGESRAEDVIIQTGETLRAPLNGPVTVASADVTQMASWRGGSLVFNDALLSDAVAEINRYTRAPIALEGEGVGGLRISGVFRSNDPEHFSQAMAEILPVEMVRHGGGRISLRRRAIRPVSVS